MEDSIVIINNKSNKGGELTYIFNLEDYLALKVLCPDLDLSNLEESIENYNNDTQYTEHNNNIREAHNNYRKNKITQTIQLRRSERIKKMNLRRSNRLAHKNKTHA
jgi:hypothetical protein